MSALICGSVAYDTIMVFRDQFKNHILPEKVHMLSVSFLAPDMRKEYGGCAGNIAYNLHMIGGDALPMATVGKDFGSYAEWMDECGINRKFVSIVDSEFTAQAFITTDLEANQIAAFHPGAMAFSHLNDVHDAEDVELGIVAPDGRDGMLQHAAQFAEAEIPFIFDPGQAMPLYDGEDLRRFIEQAKYVTVNDYEWSLLQDKSGWNEQEVLEHVDALLITRGALGSLIHTKSETYDIPPARAEEVIDPTGCGDAHRAGLIHGLVNGMDWETTGRLGSLMGSIKISSHGTQNHRIEASELGDRFKECFGREL